MPRKYQLLKNWNNSKSSNLKFEGYFIKLSLPKMFVILIRQKLILSSKIEASSS